MSFMENDTAKISSLVKGKLLTDLPAFLENPKNSELARKIETYCSDAMKDLSGKMLSTEQFSKFIDILYGCQQLDDFGEQWAPTKEKVVAWVVFLKKFEV